MKISVSEKFLLNVYDVLQKSGKFILHSYPKNINKKVDYKVNKRQFRNLVYYLKRKGYIKITKNNGVILTKEGINKALKASFKSVEFIKRKDGKWIMIAFDIPVNNKGARRLLNSILKDLGYKMFQQSVWVTPYDVFNKTEKALQMYSLDKFVRIFLIEEL